MKNRSKILTFGLIVLIIFTGVIYAQNQKTAEEAGDKFEITENKETEQTEKEEVMEESDQSQQKEDEQEVKTESDVKEDPNSNEEAEQETDTTEAKSKQSEFESGSKDSALDSADRNAGMIELEEIIATHPETEEIYEEYQAEKEQIKEGENEENNLAKLKKTYTYLIVEKTESDLKDFAEAKELDLLVINDQIVLGEKKEEEELPELENKSEEFKDFLNN